MIFLFHLIVSTVIKALAFWYLSTELFPDTFIIDGGLSSYVMLALVFGFLNTFLLPVLKILTIPIRFITLGLFSFVLNGFLLWLTKAIVNFLAIATIHIEIEGWFTYFMAGLLLSIISTTLQWILKD